MPDKIVNIEEAKNRLADLITIATEGGEVVIVEDDKPLARLVAVTQPKRKHVAGLNRGSVWTSQDFDEPLSDEFWTAPE